MMKRSLFISFLFAALGMFGQAKIEFNELYHDFGALVEGEKPTYVFKFKNVGNKPLILTSVKPSCGCTSPFWSKDTVAPGQGGEIKVQYNSAHRVGTFGKSINIRSNAINNVDQVKIYGVVFAEGTDSLSNSAALSPKINVSKTQYSIGEIELFADYEVKVQVKNTGAATLQIMSAKAGCGCIREKEKISIAPGKAKEVIVIIRPREKGSFVIQGVLETNDPSQRYFLIELIVTGKKSLTQDNMMFSQPGSGF